MLIKEVQAAVEGAATVEELPSQTTRTKGVSEVQHGFTKGGEDSQTERKYQKSKESFTKDRMFSARQLCTTRLLAKGFGCAYWTSRLG